MATSWASSSTSSISKTISNCSLQSKFLKFEKCNAARDINTHQMKNFEKLEPTLRNLNIKFDSSSVQKIMKGERG